MMTNQEPDRPTFICEDCAARVFAAVVLDDLPVCAVCRFIRSDPAMSERFKAHLRGL
jgi:hypothetical protein